MDTSIIAKLQKLEALTQSPNVHEAALAAAKLSELLLKHDLTMTDLAQREDRRLNFGKHGRNIGERVPIWKRAVLQALAQTHNAYIVQTWEPVGERDPWGWRPTEKQYVLVATAENATAIWHLYDYLTSEIDRLAARERVPYGYSGRIWKASFRDGAADTIARMIRETFAKVTAEPTSMALVIDAQAQLKQAVADIFPNLIRGRSSSSRRTYGAAYGRGQEAGRGVGIHDKVGAGNRALRG